MYVVCDVAREKTDSFLTLFFLCCVWWGKRKNSFCYHLIFSMLSMMEQVKKVILFKHYYLDVVYDGAREKTHSFTTGFFLCYLWWSKRKNSFCCNIIFCMLSLMEQEKKVILLKHYFLNVFYDRGREKTASVRTLFSVSFLWMRKRKNSFGC